MSTKYKLNNYDKEFIVKGSFYSLNIPFIGIVKCRNLLEINRINNEKGIDAIFIMMNPGSSKPLKGSDYGICYSVDEFIKKGGHTINELVDTQPDRVHMHTMEIMDRKKWDKVIVINISDIRESKSSIFKKKFKKIMNNIVYKNAETITSIFNNHRNECNILFVNNIKVVACWGMNNPKYITNDVVNFIKKNDINIVGLKGKKINGYAYLKPIGKKDKVDEIIRIINKENN